jgi:hypothetical protein
LGAPDALALVDGSDGGDLRYGINATDYVELPTARLAEYSLVKRPHLRRRAHRHRVIQ